MDSKIVKPLSITRDTSSIQSTTASLVYHFRVNPMKPSSAITRAAITGAPSTTCQPKILTANERTARPLSICRLKPVYTSRYVLPKTIDEGQKITRDEIKTSIVRAVSTKPKSVPIPFGQGNQNDSYESSLIPDPFEDSILESVTHGKRLYIQSGNVKRHNIRLQSLNCKLRHSKQHANIIF